MHEFGCIDTHFLFELFERGECRDYNERFAVELLTAALFLSMNYTCMIMFKQSPLEA